MLNPKNLILPFLGMLSGIASGALYQYNTIFSGPIGIALPGIFFAVFLSVGIYFFYKISCKKCFILFIGFSSVAYYASFWIAALFSGRLGGLLAFFLAGLAGGLLMLVAINGLLPMSKKTIVQLGVLAGVLAVIALIINFYIIEQGEYYRGMMSVGDKFSGAIMEDAGLYFLHILWNTFMALGISINNHQRLK